MNTTSNPECEAAQLALSTTMDTGLDLPEGVMEHVANCPACSAFNEAWSGSIDAILAKPLPPAGIHLRETILAFPIDPLGQQSEPRSHRGYISAVAAAIVLGFFAYILVDIRPADRGVTTRDTLAQQELAALKSDFKDGLAALSGPTGAMQRVFGR